MQSIRLYADWPWPFGDKRTPSGLMLALFWPPENATNGLAQNIRICFAEKIQKIFNYRILFETLIQYFTIIEYFCNKIQDFF